MNFNKEQLEAINTIEGNVQVISAAGSGKCIKGDSYVYTEDGIYTMEDIFANMSKDTDELSINVKSLDLNKNKILNMTTSHFFNMGKSKTIRIKTLQGFEIEGTPEHPIVVLNKDGKIEFKQLKNITNNDIIVICTNNNMWGKETKVSEDLAYIIGLLLGDGYLNGRGGVISISKSDEYLYSKYEEILFKEFPNYDIHIRHTQKKKSNAVDHIFSNINIKNELKNKYGLKMELSGDKEIPQSILNSSPTVVKRCLQGLFDTDGTFMNGKNIFEYCTKSRKMAKQIHMLLLNFGIVAKLKTRHNEQLNQDYYYLYISGSNARIFYNKVGFRYALDKQKKLEKCLGVKINDNVNLLYNVEDYMSHIRKLNNGKESLFDRDGIKIRLFDYITGRRKPSHIMANRILNAINIKDDVTEYLRFLNDNFFFDKIADIKDSECIVYDFTVPDSHSFVANGFINHNTTVLINRIKNMVSKGIDEEDILAISFTNASASDLKDKLQKNNLQNVDAGTFHSICRKILEDNGKDNLMSFVNKYKLKREIEYKTREKNVNIDDILSWIGFQKNHMLTPTALRFKEKESVYEESFLRQVFDIYEKYKHKNGETDFDDWLLDTYELYANGGCHKTWKYVLADECQDLNIVQYKLLDFFCNGKNAYITGDFFQSLYEFRAATPELFKDFPNTHENTKIINMNTNYRSCRNIVNAANEFIRPFASDYVYYKDAIASNQLDGIIKLNEFETKQEEAAVVGRKIKKLLDNGENANDIAVIYRNNSNSDCIENVLKHLGVEYKIFSNNSFFNRKEIKGILSVLRLIASTADDEAFEILFSECRFYPTSFYKGSLVGDLKTEAGKRNCTLYEAFLDHSWDKPFEVRNADTFNDFMARLRNQSDKHLPVKKIIENIIKMFKINEWIKEKYESSTIEDKLESIENLKSFSENHTVDSFVKYCASGTMPQNNTNKNGVSLISVHKSKGLEYKTVFLISLQDGKFPNKKASIESEARIFYVGATRAKENFYLSSIGESCFYNKYKEGLNK